MKLYTKYQPYFDEIEKAIIVADKFCADYI